MHYKPQHGVPETRTRFLSWRFCWRLLSPGLWWWRDTMIDELVMVKCCFTRDIYNHNLYIVHGYILLVDTSYIHCYIIHTEQVIYAILENPWITRTPYRFKLTLWQAEGIKPCFLALVCKWGYARVFTQAVIISCLSPWSRNFEFENSRLRDTSRYSTE